MSWVVANHKLLDLLVGAKVRAEIPWPTEALPKSGKRQVPKRRIEGTVEDGRKMRYYGHMLYSLSSCKEVNAEIWLDREMRKRMAEGAKKKGNTGGREDA